VHQMPSPPSPPHGREGRTCYVCLAGEEDADAPSELLAGLCACRDRAVHLACLVRWIEVSGRMHCAACGEALLGASP
jgi:E3 ubiquitin-protein ligase DOA10